MVAATARLGTTARHRVGEHHCTYSSEYECDSMSIKRRVFISFQSPDLIDERRRPLQDEIIRQIEQLDLQPEMFFQHHTYPAMPLLRSTHYLIPKH